MNKTVRRLPTHLLPLHRISNTFEIESFKSKTNTSVIQTMQFLKQEFPNIEESYFQVLLQGIVQLTENRITENVESRFDRLISVGNQDWHLYFKKREDYLIDLLKIWPTVTLFQIENQLSRKNSFDESLAVYQQSGFGVYLANTKMISRIYKDIRIEWEKCFESWEAGNIRIIHPVSGLSIESLRKGIRQVLNEIILRPMKYHEEKDEFRRIIKRHYQLILTEQNS